MVTSQVIVIISIVVTLGYFTLKRLLEPYLDKLNTALLEQELERLTNLDKLYDAKLKTQEQQDKVNEKKRQLSSGESFLSKLRKEWDRK